MGYEGGSLGLSENAPVLIPRPSVSAWFHTVASGLVLPLFTPSAFSALIETDSYRNEHSAPPCSVTFLSLHL